MYKRIICTALLSVLIGLTGCAKTEETVTVPEMVIEEVVEEPATENNLDSEEVQSVETQEEEEFVEEELTHESKHASTVLEDEEAVYFCGKQHILKWDKETQETNIIWMTDREKLREEKYAYRDMRGILIEDMIYFIESWPKNSENPMASEMLYALSAVSTDGSTYQEIEQISSAEYLVLLDGILYFSYDMDSKALEGYVVNADGSLMVDSGRVVTEPANLPQECTTMSYYNNGVRSLTPVESAYRFGYYFVYDENYDNCVIDQNTGERIDLPQEIKDYSLITWNSEYFLMEDYMENIMYLVDNDTWEIRLLVDLENDASVIGMDEEYVYWQRYFAGDDFAQNIYERINIETATMEELFVMDEFVGMSDTSPWYLMDISLVNDYLYYVGVMDYKYYLMRRDVNMPNAEEIIGEDFYDSGISDVGTIKKYKEVIYSQNNPERRLGEIDLEWLVVDERFSGADAINAVLEAKQQENIAYERSIAQDMEDLTVDGIQSSLSSEVSSIYYFNELFISFTQQEYDYTGGAHGMPYWVPYTFDLETGKQLGLGDIVANSEDELKEIVKAEFTEMYNVDPGMYWNDAIDIVYDSVSLDWNFYLREDGLVIYFGPYDLAPYAAGFQEIVVPYEKLDLYIPLGE